VVGSFEYGDEPLGSGAAELVSKGLNFKARIVANHL
jgi:hypothetical protein